MTHFAITYQLVEFYVFQKHSKSDFHETACIITDFLFESTSKIWSQLDECFSDEFLKSDLRRQNLQKGRTCIRKAF